jgi:DNA-binding winged helix-turn-helix (wHTH) protein
MDRRTGHEDTAAAAAREYYRLADLELDAGAMRVWRGSCEVRLPPLSFELLLLLVRRAPDVVTHEECLRTVWPDVVVGPEALKQRVKLVREALGDDSRHPRYVETVRGRGYRLVPEVGRGRPAPADWQTRLRSRLREWLGPGGALGLAIGAALLLAGFAPGIAEDREEQIRAAAAAGCPVEEGMPARAACLAGHEGDPRPFPAAHGGGHVSAMD